MLDTDSRTTVVKGAIAKASMFCNLVLLVARKPIGYRIATAAMHDKKNNGHITLPN